MELKGRVQYYDWGKLGKDSMVAKLVASSDSTITIDKNKPYAELWMGTHPNGPSLLIERNILLSNYIRNNSDAIGPEVHRKFGLSIPFLLKILSVRKALSIQAHPNKNHAEILHQNFPDIYKDPNHKPELAIALTRFETLCGFRHISEIKMFIQNLPELCNVLSPESVNDVMSQSEQDINANTAIKNVFKSLMYADSTLVADSLRELLSRLEFDDEYSKSTLMYPTLQKLHTDYPGDVGCWAIYLMNYLELNPGEAIYLAPNLPHAYLSGDCVECMACSDNVVRAGLTEKRIDVHTLVDMLDYSSYSRSQLIFHAHLEDGNSCIWRPPVPDFAVVRIKVDGPEGSYNTKLRPSPSLLVVIAGEGTASDTEQLILRPGTVIFLKASRQLTITPRFDSNLELYQAMCNVS